jgi:mono/diheme cytochrome c family protein
MSKWAELVALSALALAWAGGPAAADKLGLGRPALPEEIAAWDVAVMPDGRGLRPGSGDVATGEEVFGEKCAACHGEFAEGIDSWPVLAGGAGSLRDPRPVKTVGSYWPYLSTTWDYVHRSMPFGSAQTVTVDETYAIVAFLLYSNGLVEDDFVLSNENFAEIRMPNADGFYVDDRATTEYPAFSAKPCMKDCSAPVKIVKRAADLKVTPTDEDGRPAGTLPDISPGAGE